MTVDGVWQPGLGDPSLLGWATVAAYAGAAVLGWRAKGRADESQARRFWISLMVLMLLLGLNKQLDLQSGLTAVGRELAQRGGWYERRRELQLGFIGLLAVAAPAVLAWLALRARPWTAGRLLALGGATVLALFVLARASSFHHVDELLGSSALGLRWNHWLELGGISLAGAGALLETLRA